MEQEVAGTGGHGRVSGGGISGVILEGKRCAIIAFITPLCPNYRELGPFPLMG